MRQEKLDQVIEYLTGPKALKVQELQKALGIDRGEWYSWQRSTNLYRREQLAEKLIQAFPQFFPNGEMPFSAEEPKQDLELRYIEMLEKSVEELRAERDRLKLENQTLLRELKVQVAEIREHLLH